MKIALYGRSFTDALLPYVQLVIDELTAAGVTLVLQDGFYNFLNDKIALGANVHAIDPPMILDADTNLLISLGGDGTLLDTVQYIHHNNIPVIGINFGRLGFLASINKADIRLAMEALLKGEYTIDKRSILQLEIGGSEDKKPVYALNDITIHRKDNSAMMIIHAYMNGSFLNSYWADGLIIATPTGSTAYSLSCGGPIIHPESKCIILTPVAPHNLNVRPFILPDDSCLSFEVEMRGQHYLVSADSTSMHLDHDVRLKVCKAESTINLVRLNSENYLDTLREKLLWGIDTRNY